MTASLNSAEQKVILDGVSWETYERLLFEHQEKPGTRFNYDRGTLEIMVVSFGHERLSQIIAMLVELIAVEREIDFVGAGRTTFRRKDLDRGFEPDACFYIAQPDSVRGKSEIDLNVDPPPDLVIEVDITSPSISKLPVYSAIGVPEVWLYRHGTLVFLNLEDGKYIEAPESSVLSKVTSSALTAFIESSQHLKSNIWARQVREWARTL